MQEVSPPAVMTVPAAARRLGVSPYVVRGLIARGELERAEQVDERGRVTLMVTAPSVVARATAQGRRVVRRRANGPQAA